MREGGGGGWGGGGRRESRMGAKEMNYFKVIEKFCEFIAIKLDIFAPKV